MRSTLQLSDAQVEVVTPADPGPGRSLEPESHGIFRTMIRAHVVLGLMGAVAGALVFGVLWAIEIPFIVNSAVTAAAVLVGFEAVAGLMLDGLGYGIVGLAWTEWVALASRMLVGLVLVVAALRLLDRHGRLMFLPRPGAGLWPWLHPCSVGCCRPQHGRRRRGCSRRPQRRADDGGVRARHLAAEPRGC